MDKKIILALDNLDLDSAIKITNQVKVKLLAVKIGLELKNLLEKKEIEQISKLGVPIMLDLKLQDIPHTVYRSILALKEIKFKYLTVMSLGGNEMIKQAKKAASELGPDIKVLAVTILTSLTKNELSEMGFSSSVEDAVVQLAKNSSEADGYVCSALEAKLLREKVSKDKLIFCPGIRMPGDSKNDQARSASPTLALQNGANACIMGRSLLQGDVNKNLEKVLDSIK